MDKNHGISMLVPYSTQMPTEISTAQTPGTRQRGHFLLQELSEDDIGYDGDIEVVQPDQYEEPDSDNYEDVDVEDEGYDTADSEDRLAIRLSNLHCDPTQMPKKQQPGRGRKRMSREIETGILEDGRRKGRQELDIQELGDDTNVTQPCKRRKRRVERSPTGERVVHSVSSNTLEKNDELDEAITTSSRSERNPTMTDITTDEDRMDMN